MISLIAILSFLLVSPHPKAYKEPQAPKWQLERTAALPEVRPAPAMPSIAKGRPPRYRVIAMPPHFIVSGTSQAINEGGEVIGSISLSRGEYLYLCVAAFRRSNYCSGPAH